MFNSTYYQNGIPYYPDHNQIKESYCNDPMNNEGKHYVLWSGGCDSTLLLYELLDAYGSENVIAISYKYPWLNDNKYQNEVAHREAFKAAMKLKGPKYSNFQHTEFTINQNTINGDWCYTQSNGLPQAIAWISHISIYTSSKCYIYDGTIKNDDLTIVLDGYHEIFNGIRKVLDRDIILRQPYLLLNKEQIIEKLINYDIYHYTWYCEMPIDINKPCKKCNPCKTHISSLIYLASFNDNEFNKMKAKQLIDNLDKNINEESKCNEENIEKHNSIQYNKEKLFNKLLLNNLNIDFEYDIKVVTGLVEKVNDPKPGVVYIQKIDDPDNPDIPWPMYFYTLNNEWIHFDDLIPETEDIVEENNIQISPDIFILNEEGNAIKSIKDKEIKSIIIPDTINGNKITEIKAFAFYGCKNLTSVTIPDSVTSIGDSAFTECSALTSVNIPDSVTSIGVNAFGRCTSLTSVNIPNTVETIGICAFDGCESLTSVTIAEGVTIISDSAFQNCKNLRSITIPNTVTRIYHYAFSGCESLTEVNIPNGVRYIGDYAFKKCKNLTSVTIPNSVTSIGYCAFSRCTNLTSITIPDSVTAIGENVLANCDSLKSVNYTGTEKQWNSIKILNINNVIKYNREHTIQNELLKNSSIKINYNYIE